MPRPRWAGHGCLWLLVVTGVLLWPVLARADDERPPAEPHRRSSRSEARRTRAIWAGLAVVTVVIALLGRVFGRAQRARERERRRAVDAQARAWLERPAESLGIVEDEPASAPTGPETVVAAGQEAPEDLGPADVATLLATLAADPDAVGRVIGQPVQGAGRASFTSTVMGRDADLGVEHGVKLTVEVEVPGSGPFPPRLVLHLAAPPDPPPGFHETVRFAGVVHGYQAAGRTLLLRAGSIVG